MNERDPREVDAFYRVAVENEGLMKQIQVSVLARAGTGLAGNLSGVLSAWFDRGVAWHPQEGFDGFLDVKRAKIAYEFIHKSDREYLLMIDDDTEPPLALPWMLARHEESVVGSCIVSMGINRRMMLCFSRYDEHGIPRFVDFEDGDKIPATGLAPVPHCGTGAMMIRRDVMESFTFEKDPKTGIWDTPFIVPDDVKCEGLKTGKLLEGEDIRFCKQIRKKGFGLFVDLEAHCGHRKNMRLAFPPSKRDPSLTLDNWVISQKGHGLRKLDR